jgi:4a-hydroxytetrahydrobiopterin dehydratase
MIYREFKFKDFKSALKFVNKVGKIAEREDHHPDIYFGWGFVSIQTYTHAIKGLSANDFILAAKINRIKI